MVTITLPAAFFGRIELESRIRRDGRRVIYEGRALHYDGDGKLVRDAGWEPTGVVLDLEDMSK